MLSHNLPSSLLYANLNQCAEKYFFWLAQIWRLVDAWKMIIIQLYFVYGKRSTKMKVFLILLLVSLCQTEDDFLAKIEQMEKTLQGSIHKPVVQQFLSILEMFKNWLRSSKLVKNGQKKRTKMVKQGSNFVKTVSTWFMNAL